MSLMDKRRIAGIRNWNKGRLMSAEAAFKNIQQGPISQKEIEILCKAQKELSALWTIWDKNSKEAISDYYQKINKKYLERGLK